jgi:hypothetical protein
MAKGLSNCSQMPNANNSAAATLHNSNNTGGYLSEDEEAAQRRGLSNYLEVSERIRRMDLSALPEFLEFYPKLIQEGAGAESMRVRISTQYLTYGRAVFFDALRATNRTTQEKILALLKKDFKDIPEHL